MRYFLTGKLGRAWVGAWVGAWVHGGGGDDGVGGEEEDW